MNIWPCAKIVSERKTAQITRNKIRSNNKTYVLVSSVFDIEGLFENSHTVTLHSIKHTHMCYILERYKFKNSRHGLYRYKLTAAKSGQYIEDVSQQHLVLGGQCVIKELIDLRLLYTELP